MRTALQNHLVFWQTFAGDFDRGEPMLPTLEHVKTKVAGTELAPVVEHLIQAVTAGAALSSAMAERPEVFSRCVCEMMRAGEAGGVMDVTAHRVLTGLQDGSFPLPGAGAACEDEPVRYWRAFGHLLSSGLPVLRTLDLLAAEVAGPRLQRATRALHQAVRDGQDLATAMKPLRDVFTEELRVAVEHGQRSGTLDEQLLRIADALEAGDLSSLAGDPSAAEASDPAQEDGKGVVDYVNAVLREAIRRRASDVHFDPTEDGRGRVRARIDGVLQDVDAPPEGMYAKVVNRVKLMSGMDVAERRMPQDGRIRTGDFEGKDLDLRISVLPTHFGERLLIRPLDRGKVILDVARLGLTPDDLERVRQLCRLPRGMVIVNGPAGSGQTTLIYAMLQEIDRDRHAVITVEDPIEYLLPGVAQTQIDLRIGLTFARTLRHILRQGPDVVMVGELRDLELMQIGVQVALTGHLLLTTLHANTCVEAIRRLIDVGVEPFLVNASLSAVITPRLLRLLCPKCKQPGKPALGSLPPEAAELVSARKGTAFCTPKGCEHCRGTGYFGRTQIHEILVMDDRVRQTVTDGADFAALQQVACQAGMKTLMRSGLERAAEGVTSIEEVLRVVPVA